jgi:sterol 3beta-glucosyltransferase
MMRRLLDEEWHAVRSHRPDVLIYHPKSFGSPHMATELGVPHILASPLPGFTPTAAFPSPMLPVANLGPLNRPSHLLTIHAASMLFAKDLRTWRDVNGLDRRGSTAPAAGTLYTYSPSVVPVPPDWGREVLVSGYWFLDAPDWQPDDGLRAFLGAGDKPVYVGFGSMPGLDPLELTAIVVEGLSRAGKRGVLASGWGALAGTALPPHVHLIREAPHDRLLPLVSAAIHHGGAGTTAASLRAGVPTTIVPFFGDQPFWARRVAALGVGPASLDRRNMAADAIASALRAMDDPGMKQRAAALGRAIRGEDGLAAAVGFIEERTAAARRAT